jgi:hypothetical protein
MEHADTDYPRRKDFRVPIGPRSFAAQLRGIKVVFIFSRRKPLGSETPKCPSLAKRVLQMAEKTL